MTDVAKNLILAIRSWPVHSLTVVDRDTEFTILPNVKMRVAFSDIKNSSRGEATRGRQAKEMAPKERAHQVMAELIRAEASKNARPSPG